MLIFLGHYLAFPSGLLRGSLSSCSSLCRAGSAFCWLSDPALLGEQGDAEEFPFPVPLTRAQQTLRPLCERDGCFQLCLSNPLHPSQSWAGVDLKNSRAGRGSLPGRQTWCGATTRKAQRFHLIPKLLAWRGCHKSEGDFVVVSSDVLAGNRSSQTFPFLLPGGGKA